MSLSMIGDLHIIAASRFAAWSSLAFVAVVLFRVIYERWPVNLSDPIDRIILGSAIEALSWAAHQCYWWASSMCNISGGDCSWFARHGDMIIACYIGTLGGAALMLSPITEKLLGGRWVFVSTFVVAALWLAGLALAVGG